MKLSILIPVFNEEKTVLQTLQRVYSVVLSDISKEIIVVDDGSTDTSASIISNFIHPAGSGREIQNSEFKKGVKIISHKKNSGKAAAIQTGLRHAKGDYILIQDADLEYDPEYISQLLQPIKEKKAYVVFGTRLKRFPHLKNEEKNPRFLLHYFGNRTLSLLTSLLYGQWITDMETGYKLIPRKVIASFDLHARGFAFEPEITAKLLKKRYMIYEIPIKTNPRTYKEGKKLRTFPDGVKALLTLIKYRFVD